MDLALRQDLSQAQISNTQPLKKNLWGVLVRLEDR